MPPRQVWVFTFGCWATLLAAVAHLTAHLAGPPPPASDTGRQLMALVTTYRFALPGGIDRSLLDILSGFSLVSALLLATMGGIGLIVRKRAPHDTVLMSGVARMLALSSVALLGISLTNFFIVPTLFISLMVVSFLVASVESPTAEAEGPDVQHD